jgi:predicted RNA methylase
MINTTIDRINREMRQLEQFRSLETEIKQLGSIHTPFPLAEEIVTQIAIDWSNPNLTFLDPACGRGTFLVVVYRTLLLAGHDPKHIVENMLFGWDICPKMVRLTKRMLNPNRVFRDNIECCNSRNKKNNNRDRSEMKFAVYLTNPAYNTPKQKGSTRTGQLYVEFVELGLQLSSLVVMITPSLWTDKPHVLKKRLIPGLVAIMETSKHFDINVPTCAFIYDSQYVGLCNITTSTGEKFEKDISDGVIPMYGGHQNVVLLDKLKTEENLGKLWKRTDINNNDERIGKGSIKMVQTCGIKGHPLQLVDVDASPNEFKWFNNWKVCANNVGEWTSLGGNLKIVPPNIGTSYSIVALGTNSEQQANNLLKYLSTNFVRSIVKMVKNNTPNSKTVFSNIPLVDFNKSWTNEELYEHFNLTDKEIDLIEQTIK